MLAQLRDLEALVAAEPADAILADAAHLGAALLHERRHVPWASLGITALMMPSPAVALALDPLHNLDKLGPLTAALERSAELAPGARDAGAEILLGTLAAARARFVRGPDGTALFQRARQIAGDGVLMVDVMFARGTAVARRDLQLFETTLHRVLDADLARWPDHRLANELARIKARRYLAAEHELLPR